jgi:hypothetical protein
VFVPRSGLLVLVAAASVVPSRALAFRTIRDELGVPSQSSVDWRASPVHINAAGAVLPTASVVAAATRGHAPWATTSCDVPSVVWADGEEVLVGAEDGTSSLSFVRDDWEALGLPRDAVGVTDLVVEIGDDSMAIVEVDIRLDAARTWVTAPGVEGGLFLETVVAHELGHALGLAHPCEGEACGPEHRGRLMHPLYDAEGRGELAPDDVEGICSLYGVRSCEASDCRPEEPNGSSPDGDSCIANEACESGRCERGRCVPSACTETSCEAGALGEACGMGEQCVSSMCLISGDEGYCTRSCDDQACPSGFECASVDGSAVCRLPEASSCGAASGARDESAAFNLWLMIVGLVGLSRRSISRVKR